MSSLPRCRQPISGAAVANVKCASPPPAGRGRGWGSTGTELVVPPSPTLPRKGEGEEELDSLDDRRGAHAAADAQRDQGGRLVGALEFVEHGAEDHRTGGAERMAERDGAAIDVDLRLVDV